MLMILFAILLFLGSSAIADPIYKNSSIELVSLAEENEEDCYLEYNEFSFDERGHWDSLDNEADEEIGNSRYIARWEGGYLFLKFIPVSFGCHAYKVIGYFNDGNESYRSKLLGFFIPETEQ